MAERNLEIDVKKDIARKCRERERSSTTGGLHGEAGDSPYVALAGCCRSRARPSDINPGSRPAIPWLWLYNNELPKMKIGGIAPKQKLAIMA